MAVAVEAAEVMVIRLYRIIYDVIIVVYILNKASIHYLSILFFSSFNLQMLRALSPASSSSCSCR